MEFPEIVLFPRIQKAEAFFKAVGRFIHEFVHITPAESQNALEPCERGAEAMLGREL